MLIDNGIILHNIVLIMKYLFACFIFIGVPSVITKMINNESTTPASPPPLRTHTHVSLQLSGGILFAPYVGNP